MPRASANMALINQFTMSGLSAVRGLAVCQKEKKSHNLSYSAGWTDKVENPSSLVPLALGTYVCDESTAWFDSDRLVGCPAAGSRTPLPPSQNLAYSQKKKKAMCRYLT